VSDSIPLTSRPTDKSARRRLPGYQAIIGQRGVLVDQAVIDQRKVVIIMHCNYYGCQLPQSLFVNDSDLAPSLLRTPSYSPRTAVMRWTRAFFRAPLPPCYCESPPHTPAAPAPHPSSASYGPPFARWTFHMRSSETRSLLAWYPVNTSDIVH